MTDDRNVHDGSDLFAPRQGLADIGYTAHDSKHAVVLILEDQPLIAMDLEMTLADAGYDANCVMSCKDAQLWLDRCLPDFAVVDIELNDGQCTAAVDRLAAAFVPFLVHSVDDYRNHAGTSFERGVWVSKPAAPSQLLKVIQKALTAR